MDWKKWGLALLLCGAAGHSAHAQTFSPNNIVVRVIGDGSAALSGSATTNFLKEFTPAGVATGKVFALPTTSTAAIPALTVSGSATSEGAVTLSGDGKYLLVTGYDAAPGTASVVGTTFAVTNRVLAQFDWQAGILTETRITDAYDKNNIRSAASNDGKQFWTAGATSSVRYLATASATATTSILTTPSSVRYVNIFSGQLYGSAASTNFFGIFTIGAELPTAAGQTAVLLPGFPTSGASSPYDFYINPTSDVIYVADDRTKANGGGLQKWTKSGGTFSLTYTLNTNLTAGLRGLAFAGTDGIGNSVFYAVGDTSLVKVTDSGAASAFTVLATAATNTAFRGVEVLGAGSGTTTPPDTALTSGPANGATIGTNSATFVYTGTDAATPTANLQYEVRLDGGAFSAPIAATSYTVSNLADGIHTFEVAAINAAGIADPTPAKVTFTVNTAPPVITNLTAMNLTDTAATVTWTTNNAATSQVEYRISGAASFTATAVDPALVTSHSVSLSGLTATTTYEYRARSTDGLGHEAVSAIQTFTTLDTPPAPAFTKLRITQWNVSLYTSGRVNEFQTAIYGSYQGRSMAPDIFIGEEFQVPTSVPNFLAILNTAPGSPGDWAAAPFAAGNETVPDSNTAFFYRTSKVNFQKITLVYNSNGTTADQPRNDYRYDVTFKAMGANAPTVAIYATHEKSGSDSVSIARRQIESQHIRNDAAALPSTYYYLVGGDFNVQDSAQPGYQTLINPGAGQFKDPILTPGAWNNNAAFKFVHTQDPAGTGGMDDRHDQILLSPNLVDGAGLDYDGSLTVPYSLTTWNDPNHSYRSWGNDGTSFNTTLTITGNQMVGPTIAQALVSSALTGGHLPVFLDLKIPVPTVTISGTVTLEAFAGTTPQTVTFLLHPSDGSGDITRTAPIGAAGTFSLNGIAPKTYTVHIKGAKWLAVNVAANAAAGNVSGLAATLTAGDANDDNSVDSTDFGLLIGAFNTEGAIPNSGYLDGADLNGDGFVDSTDFGLLIGNFGLVGDPLP